MLLDDLKTGWNTWNTHNLASYTLLPSGFSINIGLRDYGSGRIIRNFFIGSTEANQPEVKPQIRSYDGSYIEYDVEYGDIVYKVQSTIINDNQVVLITPLSIGIKAPVLFIETGILWNYEGYTYRKDNTLIGVLKDQKIKVYIEGVISNENNLGINNPFVAVELSKEIIISTNQKYTTYEISDAINCAKEKLLQTASQYGELSDAYMAMTCGLAWNTIFEPADGRVCTPVSRVWNMLWGGYILYCWDTFFAAQMISFDQKELAYANIDALLNKVTPEGFVPCASAANGYISLDRSQPPVGSMVVLNIFKTYKEKSFVQEVFFKLASWNKWFSEKRMLDDGTLCWGSDPFEQVVGNEWECIGVGTFRGAAYESGLDNSPMYDETSFDNITNLMNLSDVGLTGLFINDCKCLIELSSIVDVDPTMFIERLRKAEKGLQSLWCEEKGMFLNKHTDTQEFSYHVSPTNFYACFSDSVSEAQVEQMLCKYFYKEEEFFGEYMIPSISKSDVGYADQEYWRGRIWGPMNYLVYQAFLNRKLEKECGILAQKSNHLFMKEWKLHYHIHENYSAETGMGCDSNTSDKFYHWGGLLGYIALINKMTSQEGIYDKNDTSEKYISF